MAPTGCLRKSNRLKKTLTQALPKFNQIIIFSKYAMIRINFDIFFRIFSDLDAELIVNYSKSPYIIAC